MAHCLLHHTIAGIDEDDGEVGGGGTRHHVAGVLDVSGGVGDDELALGRGEVAVGHINGDALLAFGPQSVGEQREVHLLVAAAPRGLLHRFQLILENRLAVV